MVLNIFRIAADLSHLASILILLHKMVQLNSCSGISFKSQALYLFVYITRYLGTSLDLFSTESIYNLIFKILFIGSQGYIIYLMANAYKPTNDPNVDTFRVQYLIAGAAVLAVLFPYKYTFSEILWAFSIWLESVAILPQLFMLQRTGEAETITTHYLFALGSYRALYIPNWIYRYFAEPAHKPDWIAIIAGIIQTILYSDFFYIYYTKVLKGQKFKLPISRESLPPLPPRIPIRTSGRMASEAAENPENRPPTQNGQGGPRAPPNAAQPTAPGQESKLPSRKDLSLREFLHRIDEYAPIIPDAVTHYYMTKAGLPPPPQTDPKLARLLALATQKFVADIAADAYQYSRIRASSNTNANNPMGSLGAAAGFPIPGQQAGQPGSKDQGKGPPLGIQRPGYGGGGQGGSQNRTVLTMEDLGMAVGEYGVNVKRSEFYR
ncbi:hypothetical protein CP532_2731 [Ophiocordyceps camponoti-leonardi (nom. inval.)]|nr:hypothetical protein CP532_2731 [Ophiocordyceps camponoti-leonardi (nom. inval.)]